MKMIELALIAPLLLAACVCGPVRLRALAHRLAPWAGVPALYAAWLGPTAERRYDWLLFATRLELDDLGVVFLAFTAVVWTAAGVSARTAHAGDEDRDGYLLFHLLALAGNLALITAGDPVFFYLGFAVMTFAAYGLVAHERSPRAVRAARVYLVMAVIGEAALLSGILFGVAYLPSDVPATPAEFAAAVAASPWRGWIIGLLIVGFGVKAGILPLHMWLPLAHPVAPTPASAVLSGCMIKAGVVGWLRFLPLGVVAEPEWGMALVAAGGTAMFFGVAIGLAQDDAKTVLAYSSISQMGYMTVAAGLALAVPAATGLAVPAIAIYAAHHGLAKGALFLGTGVAAAAASTASRRWVVYSLVVPAAALAGAPWTSGWVAKAALEELAHAAPTLRLPAVFFVAAFGTALLMLRYLILVAGRPLDGDARAPRLGSWLPYCALVAGVIAVGVMPQSVGAAGEFWEVPSAKLIMALAPLAAAAVVAWVVTLRPLALRIPPGDILSPIESRLIVLARRARARAVPYSPDAVEPLASSWYGLYAASRSTDRSLRLEIELTRWELAALLVVAVASILFAVILLAAALERG